MTEIGNPGLTIETAIRSIFPIGYLDYPTYRSRLHRKDGPVRSTDLANPPCKAVDLFAIVGFLLLRSGAYHHVSPAVSGAVSPRTVTVSARERKAWVRAGQDWRGDNQPLLPQPPAELLEAWNELLAHKHRAVYRAQSTTMRPRKWWRAALALLCIADEAAKDIGFETGAPKSAQARLVEYEMRQSIKVEEKVYTLSGADPDYTCVLPKSRTPHVGCTLRSLSHHLALLPPRGLARAYWTPGPPEPIEKSHVAPFNLVIVPAPFRIRASAFEGVEADEGRWGWFDVEPHWCPRSDQAQEIVEGFDNFFRFVDQILTAAEKDVGEVHGLVFPEVALSHQVFVRLCERLQARRKFELLISGLFDAELETDVLRRGNFAAMASFQARSEGESTFDVSIREKHHRWRLDAGQIESYALGSALDAGRGWWERIDILSRSLDMFVLRGVSTVTTLICEDLARNDPCQELVRGIGPNLVVALLMDGPQLKDRWPARYATVLAEDPGSSVLTFTSLGLIQRANETGRFPPARQVGLWRDDGGKTVELVLPTSAQALCLTLQPSRIQERTLDGRTDDGDAQSWRLTAIAPVSIGSPSPDIMMGLWPVPTSG